MICPQCGNVITLQEYKCGKCGVDLHCNTPEERQKREEYASQMYASGQWKMPEIKTVQSFVSTADETVKYKEDKPKSRIPFIISTVVLGVFCVVLVSVNASLSNEISEKEREIHSLKFSIENLLTELDETAKHNTSLIYDTYRNGANNDLRGLKSIVDIVELLSGEDLSHIDSIFDDKYTDYIEKLDEACNRSWPDNLIVNEMEGYTTDWQESVVKMHDAVKKGIHK